MRSTTRRAFLGGLVAGGAALAAGCRGGGDASRPNVLFVSFDDLNDWVPPFGGYRGALRAPAFERAAARGVAFANAHCSAPACKPSRASALTGLAPQTVGLVGTERAQLRDAAPGAVTLPQRFRAAGWRAIGLGKVFHRADPASWDEERFGWNEPVPAGRPRNGLMPPEAFLAQGPEGRFFDWGPVELGDEAFGDAQLVAAAREILAHPPREPLFLGVGFRKPHLPWYAPRADFERVPLDEVVLPPVRDGDLDDVPPSALGASAGHAADAVLRDPAVWRRAVQAYLACVVFADRQLGALLDALDASPLADDTLVALWSDHGYQLGEKRVWRKFTLWEDATRVPLVIAPPGAAAAGRRCDEAVSLLDLAPTLLELCGIAPAAELEGESLAPWLREPDAPRERPAFTTWERHHSLRTRRWRYTRYADGAEELYDHAADPHEWVNLADDPVHAETRRELERRLDARYRT